MSTVKPDTEKHEPKDRNAVAVETYVIETHAAAMVRFLHRGGEEE